MKTTIRLIAFVAIGYLAASVINCRGCSSDNGDAETKITYKTIKDTDTVTIMRQKPVKVPYYIYKDKIVRATDTIYRDKAGEGIDWIEGSDDGNPFAFEMLNEYKDTLKLKNATVYSTMLSDGKIYEHSATVETKEKTKTETVKASGMFLSGSAAANSDLRIDNVGIGLDYIYKNDFGFGGFVQYNTVTEKPAAGITVKKKIF